MVDSASLQSSPASPSQSTAGSDSAASGPQTKTESKTPPAADMAEGTGDASDKQDVSANCLMISTDGVRFGTMSFSNPQLAKTPTAVNGNLANPDGLVQQTLKATQETYPLDIDCPQSMKANQTSENANVVAAPEYVIFHVVKWNGIHSQAIKTSRYYLFDRRTGRDPRFPALRFHPHVSNNLRVFGSKNIAFVALHFGIDNSCDIHYSIAAKSKTSIPLSELQNLLQYAAKTFGYTLPAPPKGPGVEKAPPFIVGVYGAAMLAGIQSLPADLQIDGDLAGTAKPQKPTDTDDLRWGPNVSVGCPVAAKNSNAKAQGGDQGQTDKSSSYTPGTQANQTLNSTQADGGDTAQSNQDTQPKSAFSQTIDDEGLYHWDVSVGIPVSGRKEVSYSAADNTVRRDVTTREDAYAVFHVFPFAVDLKTKGAFMGPSIVAGIPVANRPFNNPIAGVSPFGLNLFGLRFFPWAAALFERNFRPSTLTIGDSATPSALKSDLKPQRNVRLMIGISFSVKDAQSILSSKSNKSDSSGTTDQSGGNNKKKGSGPPQ